MDNVLVNTPNEKVLVPVIEDLERLVNGDTENWGKDEYTSILDLVLEAHRRLKEIPDAEH